MATDLTNEALAGFEAPKAKAPHMFSSAAWMGYRAGQAIALAGAVRAPVQAFMSRGYSVRLWSDQAKWFVVFEGEELRPRVERIA